jgi:hypothetical protein
MICGVCEAGPPVCEPRTISPAWAEQFGLLPVMCVDCLGEWHEGATSIEEIKQAVKARRSR